MQLFSLPSYAAQVLSLLTAAGYEAYVVGGCVRDSLLGRAPCDWDIATSALPQQVIAALHNIRTLETGIQHGTITALVDHQPVEITTYRIDGTYSDNRRPDHVTFTRSLQADLARRDFTVNAFAYAPTDGLIDPFGGMNDLHQRTIRCVGDPDCRFGEDALRILRALRFASTLGFVIEPSTADALRRNRILLKHVAVERLNKELIRLLCGVNAVAVLQDFSEVIAQIIPALPTCTDALGKVAPTPVLRLTMLLLPLTPQAAHDALVQLRFDRRTIRSVDALLTYRNTPLQAVRPAVCRLLHLLGEPLVRDLLAVKSACGEVTSLVQPLLDAVIASNDCWSLKQLAVNGDALLALGYQGAEIGVLLHHLLDAVMDGRLPNDPTALLQEVAKNAPS